MEASMNFKTYSDAWLEAVNDKHTSKMTKTLSDKFIWFNDRYEGVWISQGRLSGALKLTLLHLTFPVFMKTMM